MNNRQPNFPTPLHQEATVSIQSFFEPLPEVDTVLLINSCARGVATPLSDLDLAVLLKPDLPDDQITYLVDQWNLFSRSDPMLIAFQQSGKFAKIHLDLIDGQYSPSTWDDGGGPDDFELEIGNHIAYSLPLSTPGKWLTQLQSNWLPYYDQELRAERLKMVRDACIYDLDFIPMFVERSLYFQAFDRLYKAFREFLQLLFISQNHYPLAYDKWIHEQVAVGLGQEELYSQLLTILSIDSLEGRTLVKKANELRHLVNEWS